MEKFIIIIITIIITIIIIIIIIFIIIIIINITMFHTTHIMNLNREKTKRMLLVNSKTITISISMSP